MTGHETERLCAYLDRELPPGERTEVEAHLAACLVCAALLADLTAVDAAASSLPAEAPQGYFDAFPSRVVARLGAATRAPLRTRRLPEWTWAAAAALLVALVAPLTLRQPAPGPVSATTPVPAAPRPDSPVRGQKPERDALSTPAATPVPVARPQPGFASPPAAAGPAALGGSAVTERRPPARQGARNEAAFDAAQVPLPPPAAVQTESATLRPKLKDAPANSGAREEPAEATAESFAPAERERARERHAPAAATAPLAAAVRQDEETAGTVSVSEPERAFAKLEASRPRTAPEWRRLRDAWSAVAAAHADDPRSDEARVRAIEAGREAWLAGGADDDEAAFQRDAQAYLEREDALQKERVQRLLLPPRRP